MKIGFIGAGKMATAIVKGLISNGFSKDDIAVYDIAENAIAEFAKVTEISGNNDVENLIANSDTIVLAVKPQYMERAVKDYKSLLKDKLIISIAAGVKIDSIQKMCGAENVIRVMPNTPALVGEGASAYAISKTVSKQDAEFAEKFLNSFGKVVSVPENLLDAVTGLSGSGPAYVFDFIQGLADGGVKEGLPRDIALQLAAQTVFGAAKLMIETGEHPAVLKDMVTSPGGTTAAGLATLEKNAFKGTLIETVSAATNRSKELG